MTEAAAMSINQNGSVVSRREDLFKTLKELCANNAEFFSKDNSENGQRLYISFLAINDAIDQIGPKIISIEKRLPDFDFDEHTLGNGYRSYIHVINLAVKLATDFSQKVTAKRGSVLFRKSILTKEIESCSHLLTSLDGCLVHLQKLLSWCEPGDLFAGDDHPPDQLLKECGEINQHCFYGRNLGFQYCDSIRNVMQFIALSMTLFSEVFYSQGSLISKATNSFMTTTKYLTDPDQRARRIVNISHNAEVDFCKAFWFLAETEIMNQLPAIVSPSVAVSKIIHLPPEPLTLNVNGEEIEVPIPSSYIGRKPIQLRLISHKVRQGMLGTKDKPNLAPPSRGLLIHCHGGGFVAQSSKSHESYLRDWAKQLDVPILCIDYSLAPEAPFPRALEEILYAYAWALNNHELLGSTGESIVGAGDSAGANLLLSMTLSCLRLNVPLLKGVFVAYVPTGVHFRLSPARLLCMMDPLLPFGFLMRCLQAYACPGSKACDKETNLTNSNTESFEEISESDLVDLQARKSPVSITSDTLTYGSLISNIEDENAEKCSDLNAAEVEKSEKCVSDFLEKYILESDTETEASKETHQQEEPSKTDSVDRFIPTRVSSFVANLKGQFAKFISTKKPETEVERILVSDIGSQGNMADQFTFTVPNDPLLSPILASDEDLKRFPPTRVLSVHLDPCLDDCIMFAKRLKLLGKDVKFDILDGLPHGFLNFSLFSREAYNGSKVCIDRIMELLNLNLAETTEQ